MRPSFIATNVIWCLHKAAPAFADPKGHIEHTNQTFGHMFKTQEGDDDDGDTDKPPVIVGDETGAMSQVVAKLLSNLYHRTVLAGVDSITPSKDDSQHKRAWICLDNAEDHYHLRQGCHVSSFAAGDTAIQAEVDAWAQLAYQVSASFEPLFWDRTPSSTCLLFANNT